MSAEQGSPEERTEAIRTLEGEFSELIMHFRRIIAENANRVSEGMLPGAYKVFATIARCDGVTVSTLADRMLADKGQISRTVRELEQLGLVERTPDPRDGRSAILALTSLGVERLAAARLPQEGLLLKSLRGWSIDDIRSLTRLLNALVTGTTPGR